MNWLIERKLNRLSKSARPNRVFKVELRRELVGSFGTNPLLGHVLKPAIASLTLVVALGAGTGVYAYNSDDVIPDHPLYGVREGIEGIESSIATHDPSALAATERKHLARRMREIERMRELRRDVDERHIARVTRQIEHALQVGDGLPVRSREAHDEIVSKLEQRRARLLQRVHDEIPEGPKRERIERIIDEDTERLGNRIDQLAEDRKQRFEQVRIRRAAIRERLRPELREAEIRLPESGDLNLPSTIPPVPSEPAAEEIPEIVEPTDTQPIDDPVRVESTVEEPILSEPIPVREIQTETSR